MCRQHLAWVEVVGGVCSDVAGVRRGPRAQLLLPGSERRFARARRLRSECGDMLRWSCRIQFRRRYVEWEPVVLTQFGACWVLRLRGCRRTSWGQGWFRRLVILVSPGGEGAVECKQLLCCEWKGGYLELRMVARSGGGRVSLSCCRVEVPTGGMCVHLEDRREERRWRVGRSSSRLPG